MKKHLITMLLFGIRFCVLAQNNLISTPLVAINDFNYKANLSVMKDSNKGIILSPENYFKSKNNALVTETPSPKPPLVVFYGFIRNDIFYDSRINAVGREGFLNLYPLNKSIVNGVDLNDKSQLNFLTIYTKLGVNINGPAIIGAKLSGTIEVDFIGSNDANIGSLRLRLAFIKLDWSKVGLTIGQTWYPMLIQEAFPGSLNFNTGILFNPYGWANQVKLSLTLAKNLYLHVSAYEPREFSTVFQSINYTNNTPTASSPAVSSVSSTAYVIPNNTASINAGIPGLNAHLQYKSDKFVFGVQFDYTVLKPYTTYRDSTIHAENINNETVKAITFMAYGKVITKPITIKANFTSAENAAHWVMMGGYFGYKNPAIGLETYKPAKTSSWWIDFTVNGKKWVPGIFVGSTSNNGAEANATAAYGRAIGISGTTNIQNLFRVAPRLEFIAGKLKFGTEIEFTTANYGTLQNNGVVNTALPITGVTNTRFLFSTIYSF